MKYEAGDKVRIRKDLKKGDNFELWVDDEMEKLAGKKVTIIKVFRTLTSVRYNIDKDRGFYSWTEDMFEDFEKPTNNELLRMPIGTIIKTDREENNVFVKVGEKDFCNNNCDHILDQNINKDLSLDCYFSNKIIEIQEPTYNTIYKADKKIKEMTIAEIEKELGYPIKVVKEEE